MSVREPFSWIEIDMDGCGLEFGVGACTAALGVNGVQRKCYKLYNTCRLPIPIGTFVHTPTFRTLRYCQPRSSMPKGSTYYPVMKGSPTEVSATVNIAGSDSDLSSFGRVATLRVPLFDFPDHDRYLDPYHAERLSGAAQADGIGYNPLDRGTHFGRMKVRWPFFAGRALRRCDGYIVNGALVDVTMRHYVLTNISGPGDDGQVIVEASDVLDFADDKRTRVPAPSNGALLADIGTGLLSFTLTPTDIGNSAYPAAGRARIGSEFVDYTRVDDVITLTARGVSSTVEATHKAADTFQIVKSYVNARVDDVVADLLQEAGIDAGFLPLLDWAAEVDRWLTGILITRDIGEPTGIKSLMSTLVPLGFSLWWDSAAPKIRLKANRPVDGDPIWVLTDETSNLTVEIEEDDKKRLSDVLFWTVQKNPSGSATSTDNYARTWAAADPGTRETPSYRSGRVKSFLCPWLNTGNDAIVRVAARRLLQRFNKSPVKATITLDAEKWKVIQLTDVIRLTTRGLQDDTGLPVTRLFEVIQRSEPKAGERLQIIAQSYQFTGRFAFATPNDAPSYLLATEAQRDPGMFACDPLTLVMPDGTPPYEAI